MADDPTITWRLDRIEETLRDLSQRVVGADLYARDRAEFERDFAEIRRDLAELKLALQAAIEAERQARKEADKTEAEAREKADRDLKGELAGQGTNWRQAIYAGLIPTLLFLVGILLQLKGGK